MALISFISCNNDDDTEYSAIADFIGEWQIEGRTFANCLPVEIGDEFLVFSEDNNFEDLVGRYRLSGETESTGHFFISTPSYDLNFENSIGAILTADFNIYNGILTLEYINNDGQIVREVWRKNYYYETE